MFDCHFLESYNQKKRFGKKVILWCTGLSEQSRRHPHHAQGIKRCLQSMQCDNGLWRGSITIITKRFNMACSTVYQLWEQAACTCAMGDIISPENNSQKKLQEASYISERVHPGGCQGCPTAEEAYPKKLATLMGVSKTTVHCWIVGLTIRVHCNSLKPV